MFYMGAALQGFRRGENVSLHPVEPQPAYLEEDRVRYCTRYGKGEKTMCPEKLVAFLVGLLVPLFASAQPPQLTLPDFEHLQARAIESVDIHVGAFPLWLAAHFMGEDDPEDVEARAVIKGLRGVHVRSYEFDSDDAYSREDVEKVRRQQVVRIRDRDKRADVVVFIATDGEKINGIAVIASEPREFTIVHVVGNIDVDKLARLQGSLGVPHLDLGATSTVSAQ